MVTVPRPVTVAAGVLAPGHLGELTGYVPFELVDDVLEETLTVQRRTRLLLIGMMAAGFALIGLSHDVVPIALGAALCGGGGGLINPYVSGLMLAQAPPFSWSHFHTLGGVYSTRSAMFDALVVP